MQPKYTAVVNQAWHLLPSMQTHCNGLLPNVRLGIPPNSQGHVHDAIQIKEASSDRARHILPWWRVTRQSLKAHVRQLQSTSHATIQLTDLNNDAQLTD